MPTTGPSSFIRAAIFIGGLLAALAAFWLLPGKPGVSARPEPSVALLETELAAITLPAEATRVAPAESEARIGSVRAVQRFSWEQDTAAARDYFKAELQRNGWQFKSGADGPPWNDSYCKATLYAQVAPSIATTDSANSSDSVTVNISWNELTLRLCGGSQ
jgi:hypothetical protein